MIRFTIGLVLGIIFASFLSTEVMQSINTLTTELFTTIWEATKTLAGSAMDAAYPVNPVTPGIK